MIKMSAKVASFYSHSSSSKHARKSRLLASWNSFWNLPFNSHNLASSWKFFILFSRIFDTRIPLWRKKYVVTKASFSYFLWEVKSFMNIIYWKSNTHTNARTDLVSRYDDKTTSIFWPLLVLASCWSRHNILNFTSIYNFYKCYLPWLLLVRLTSNWIVKLLLFFRLLHRTSWESCDNWSICCWFIVLSESSRPFQILILHVVQAFYSLWFYMLALFLTTPWVFFLGASSALK